VKHWKVLLAGLVSSKETGETAALNGGKETEQTKNIMVLQFTSRRGFIQKIMVLIGLQGYVQQKYHES